MLDLWETFKEQNNFRNGEGKIDPLLGTWSTVHMPACLKVLIRSLIELMILKEKLDIA